jgi:hypothetical protein
MKEKIEQLCDQIKDLLKENNREYIVAITPEETYSYPDFTFPEYFKNIIDNSEYGFNELLCDDSIDVDWDDFIIDEDVEPVYVDDYDEEDYDDEEYDEEDCILYDEISQYLLIAIRIESDKLVFCVEKIFTDDEQTACENVKEVSISSLVDDYGDETVVRALEAYVRLLSDTTKDSMFWKI